MLVLVLPWHKRDAERISYGLLPDGLWNATCPAGATLCGFKEEDRAKAEELHFQTCRCGAGSSE